MRYLLLLLSLFVFHGSIAQTIGLISHDTGTFDDGYILFSPITYTNTYLIDKCGKLIHSWNSSYRPGQSVYLLSDGVLLRPGNAGNPTFTAGGNGGIIEKLNWDGSVLWSYALSDTAQCQHHDVVSLPNGNILAIVWELKSTENAIAAGRNPSLLGSSLWSEKIVELQPTGTAGANIVWEWHVWDHLVQDYDASRINFGVVSANPGLVNINYAASTTIDWLHFNSIDYDPRTDQVLLSNHNFNEVWVVDHSTSTIQAASHSGGLYGKGGDLLYRWGNPAAYNTGTPTDQKLWGQHNAHWIKNAPDSGKIVIFNNGHGLSPATNYSSVEVIQPPVDAFGFYSSTLPYLPASSAWSYQASTPTDFFAMNISGAQQLPNGSMLICNGPAGDFFEVTQAKTTVWEYVNPVKNTGPMSQGTTPSQNLVFRCTQYPSDFSGFSGHDLVAGDPIELNPINYICATTTKVASVNTSYSIEVFPNPAHEYLNISGLMQGATVLLKDLTGAEKYRWVLPISTTTNKLNLPSLVPGNYVLQVVTPHMVTNKRVLVN